MEILDNIKVDISPQRVLRLQGYRSENPTLSPPVEGLLRQAIEEGYRLIQSRACYAEMAARLNGEGKVVLENGTVLDVTKAGIEWKGLERVRLAICTIGAALEERCAQLFARGEYALSVMLDSVGSVAVGSVVGQVDALACERAQELGMVAGPRFEPGSVGWPLTEQRLLFGLLPAGRVGVRLNEQCQMIPRKSVSLAVGMGREMPRPRGRHPCWHCNLTSCPFRDAGALAK